MFYTLTANPAVDMTVSSSPLEPDENVRTGSASYTANGKGLDVSFAFKKMGVDTVALGFFAGFTGKFIVEEVMNLGCLCRPVWTDGINAYQHLRQRWPARVRHPEPRRPDYAGASEGALQHPGHRGRS